VETAPGALYQIITNLVMNSLTHGFAPARDTSAMDGNPSATEATEATEATDRREGRAESGGRERPVSGSIRIDVRRDEVVVRIDYRDNGRGMDESVRSRIFEPFFTTRRGQGGSGLGMHIVYNLVTQSLQGSIECVSAPGQGVLFRIVLPAPMPS
jgi:signal transduction histidine kinase